MLLHEKINRAEAAIEKAREVFIKKFPHFTGSLASSPVFAEILTYFLEEETETKQLLKD